MSTIVTRAAKGSALSWIEVDANFTNLNNDTVQKDANGNIGLGVTPSAWAAGSALQLNNQYAVSYQGFVRNAYFDGSVWKYTTTAAASRYAMSGGLHYWYTAPSGTAGNTITFTQAMTLDASGNLLLTASGGLGYGTGSGGAVTQATSRVTGVTLHNANGAITLVSAAGSATWQTFTVTNSKIAATDVVKVCQKSGTDKYMIHVTNVSAGSFQITFATTGGTTTEQPVFNFAVIKAVTA